MILTEQLLEKQPFLTRKQREVVRSEEHTSELQTLDRISEGVAII